MQPPHFLPRLGRVWLLLLALAGAATLASCERAVPTEPGLAAERQPLLTSGDAPPMVLGAFGIPPEPPTYGNTGRVDWTATGIAVPPGAYVRVSVTNGLTLQRNTHFEPMCGNRTCFAREGEFIPPSNYSLGPKITFGTAPAPSPGTNYNKISVYDTPGGTGSWGYFYHNAGSTTKYIYVMRAGLPGAVCYEYKCYPPAPCCAAAFTAEYRYTGSQEIVVEQVRNPVQVRALTPRIRPGEAATFSVRIDGVLRKQDGSPGTIRWIWAPSDTLAAPGNAPTISVTDSLCYNRTTCTYTPTRSGRMYVTADVEGIPVQNGSEVVWRRSCEMYATPPADPLLLDPEVLNTLEDLAKRTGFTSPVRDRREHGKYILSDGQRHFTREFEYLQEPYPMPTPCDSDHRDMRRVYEDSGYIVAAEIHTHPSAGHEYLDNRDGICPTRARDARYEFKDGPSGSGREPGDLDPWENPSSGERRRAERLGQALRQPYMHLGFVLDQEHVHRWERNSDGTITLTRFNLNRGSTRCIA